MWIMTNRGFISCVAHRDRPECLLVRARCRGHLEAIFGNSLRVHCTPDGDYRYRAAVPRGMVASVVAGQLAAVDYDNFKASVPDRGLHDVYLEVWESMYAYQRRGGAPVGHGLSGGAVDQTTMHNSLWHAFDQEPCCQPPPKKVAKKVAQRKAKRKGR